MYEAGHNSGQTLPDVLKSAGYVGAWFHDTATDRVIADRPVAELYGIISPDPACGDSIKAYAKAVHPADRVEFNSLVKAASIAGSPFSARYRIMTTTGSRLVHDFGSFLLDQAGRPMRGQGIIIDATETQNQLEAVAEISAVALPDAKMATAFKELSLQAIALSEIARALPSPRLHGLTDALLWEAGRLLAWTVTRRKLN